MRHEVSFDRAKLMGAWYVTSSVAHRTVDIDNRDSTRIDSRFKVYD